MHGLIVGVRLGYNNEMGLSRNTVGWRGLIYWTENGNHRWAVVWRVITTSFIDIIQRGYTGRARSRLASMHKKRERLNSPILTDCLCWPGGRLWPSPIQAVIPSRNVGCGKKIV